MRHVYNVRIIFIDDNNREQSIEYKNIVYIDDTVNYGLLLTDVNYNKIEVHGKILDTYSSFQRLVM